MTVLAAMAQLERKTIRGRQAEGIAIPKFKGVYDRVHKLAADQASEASQRVVINVSKVKVARGIGASRQTLYAALNGSGSYAEMAEIGT